MQEISLGVSLSDVALKSSDMLFSMFPFIKHVQVKLPAQSDGRRKPEECVESFRKKFPSVELSVHASGQINLAEPVGTVRQTWVELAKQAIKFTADMGGKFVVFHGGSAQGRNPVAVRAAARNHLCDSLDELLDYARDVGVLLHLENIYPAPFRSELVRLMDRVEDYKYILDSIADDKLKFCFDFGHAMIDDRGMPILDEILLQGKLGSLHIHENDRVNDLHLPPTDLFDWQTYFDKIIKNGDKPPFILETKVEQMPQAMQGLAQLLL